MNKHSEETGLQLLAVCMSAYDEARNSPLTATIIAALTRNFPTLRPQWQEFIKDKQIQNREAAMGIIHEAPKGIEVTMADMGFPMGATGGESFPTYNGPQRPAAGKPQSNAQEVDMMAGFNIPAPQPQEQTPLPLSGQPMKPTRPQEPAKQNAAEVDAEAAGKEDLAIIEGTQALNADEIAQLKEAGKSAASLFPVERLQKTCLVMGIPNAELTPRQMVAAIKQKAGA